MRLRERLSLLLHKFERALTRVEDQGARVENGVDNIKTLVVTLHTAVEKLSFDVNERYRRSEKEITGLKNRLSVLEKVLEHRNQTPH